MTRVLAMLIFISFVLSVRSYLGGRSRSFLEKRTNLALLRAIADPYVQSSMVGTKRRLTSKRVLTKESILSVLLDSETDASLFSSEIKTLAAKRSLLAGHERKELFERAMQHMNEMGCEQVSSCVWSLGTLGCAPLKNSESSRVALEAHVSSAGEHARRGDLVRMLSGLSKMRYRWNDVPSVAWRALLRSLDTESGDLSPEGTFGDIVQDDLDAKQTSILIYTLGQLGATFSTSIDIANSSSRGKSRHKHRSHIEGAQRGALPPPVQRGLLLALANSLHAKADGSASATELIRSEGENTIDSNDRMTSQGLVNSLHGLARMGMKWDHIPALFSSPHDNETGATITEGENENEGEGDLDSGGTDNANTSTAPITIKTDGLYVQDAIAIGIASLAHVAGPLELSSMTNSLALLRVQWRRDLSVDQRLAVMDAYLAEAVDGSIEGGEDGPGNGPEGPSLLEMKVETDGSGNGNSTFEVAQQTKQPSVSVNKTNKAKTKPKRPLQRRTVVDSLGSRELANVIWALGKLDFDFSLSSDTGDVGTEGIHINIGTVGGVSIERGTLNDKGLESKELFCAALLHRLSEVSGSLSAFDFESVAVGLGLMQVNWAGNGQQNYNIWRLLAGEREREGDKVNIFFLHNVLWGLARSGATTTALDRDLGLKGEEGINNRQGKGLSLSDVLFRATLNRFHSFLPEQFGDVVWALGELGYDLNDLDDLNLATDSDLGLGRVVEGEEEGEEEAERGDRSTYNKLNPLPPPKTRMLAILGRVLPKLGVHAVVYSLLGLSRMGLTWEKDFLIETRSLPTPLKGGRDNSVSPFGTIVGKYLRQRVGSLKEHEYAMLLYSLGQLGFTWHNPTLVHAPSSSTSRSTSINTDTNTSTTCTSTSPSPPPDVVMSHMQALELLYPGVENKIHHRATRVSSFLTARSLANALEGLSRCGVRWAHMPSDTQNAWIQALLGQKQAQGISSVSEKRGAATMTAMELQQTLHSLAEMGASWDSMGLLGQETRQAVEGAWRDIQVREGEGEGEEAVNEALAMEVQLSLARLATENTENT